MFIWNRWNRHKKDSKKNDLSPFILFLLCKPFGNLPPNKNSQYPSKEKKQAFFELPKRIMDPQGKHTIKTKWNGFFDHQHNESRKKKKRRQISVWTFEYIFYISVWSCFGIWPPPFSQKKTNDDGHDKIFDGVGYGPFPYPPCCGSCRSLQLPHFLQYAFPFLALFSFFLSSYPFFFTQLPPSPLLRDSLRKSGSLSLLAPRMPLRNFGRSLATI